MEGYVYGGVSIWRCKTPIPLDGDSATLMAI